MDFEILQCWLVRGRNSLIPRFYFTFIFIYLVHLLKFSADYFFLKQFLFNDNTSVK